MKRIRAEILMDKTLESQKYIYHSHKSSFECTVIIGIRAIVALEICRRSDDQISKSEASVAATEKSSCNIPGEATGHRQRIPKMAKPRSREKEQIVQIDAQFGSSSGPKMRFQFLRTACTKSWMDISLIEDLVHSRIDELRGIKYETFEKNEYLPVHFGTVCSAKFENEIIFQFSDPIRQGHKRTNVTDMSKHIVNSRMPTAVTITFPRRQSVNARDNLGQLTTFTFPAPKEFSLHVLDYAGLNNVHGSPPTTLRCSLSHTLNAKGEPSQFRRSRGEPAEKPIHKSRGTSRSAT
ncbi:hypothetical protein WN51_10671 [Melipona quadrifasciata]|uniref:Uncharacterized protein n=1 Tax=Melipona quadrifasciata TaxID=166423 RepID=A0A0M9AE76_9HYME|nr:hypothetical protein WN51_10671 [Melipona quadrifasciata]